MESKPRLRWSPVLVDGASHAKTERYSVSIHRKNYGWTARIVANDDPRMESAKKATFMEFMKYDYVDPFHAAQDWCERFLLGEKP